MMKKLFFTLITLVSVIFNLHAQTVDNLKFGPKKETIGTSLDKIIAIAGDDVITQRELEQLAQNNDRNAILQQLITKSLLLQTARKMNINVDDTAVNLAIEDQAKKSGITIEQLRKKVIQQNRDYATFRENVKDGLIISRLQQSVANHYVKITDQEIDDAMEKQLSQVTDSAHLVDLLIKVPETNDPEILNKAQARTRQVIESLKNKTPEEVAARFSDVDYHDLGWVELSKIPTKFTEGLMDIHPGQYANPIIDRDGVHILKVVDRQSATTATVTQETKASHILIRNDGNPDAKKDIDKIRTLIQKGKDFAELAELYSQDTGSAAKGGDLGWVAQGQMVPEFENAMNQLKVGEVSQPVRSNFGWHIIKVFDRREIKSKNQEMLKQKARMTIFQRKAAEEWEVWLTQLRDESYIKIFEPDAS